MGKLKFAVIGAGHGGKAIAAHLALKGFPVKLYNRTLSKIIPIIKMGGNRDRRRDKRVWQA